MKRQIIVMLCLALVILFAFADSRFYRLHDDAKAECKFCNVSCNILPREIDDEGNILNWQLVCPNCGRRGQISSKNAEAYLETITTKATAETITEKQTGRAIDEVPESETADIMREDEVYCAKCGSLVEGDVPFWYEPDEDLISRRRPPRGKWLPLCKICATRYFYDPSPTETRSLDDSRVRPIRP